MINKFHFQSPVHIPFNERPVTLVDQLIGGNTTFVKQVCKKRFGTIKISCQRKFQKLFNFIRRALEVMAYTIFSSIVE